MLQCKCCKGSANSTGLHECEGHCSQEENGNMLNHEFSFFKFQFLKQCNGRKLDPPSSKVVNIVQASSYVIRRVS